MPTRRPLLLGCLLGCTTPSTAENAALNLEPRAQASPSARASMRAPLAKPTTLELNVTDKAGRTLRVSLGSEAFAGCLAGAEPGERGYALLSARLDGTAPGSRRVVESDGLSAATLSCVTEVLAGHREPMATAPETLWYFSVRE